MAASQSIGKLTAFDRTQPSLHQTLWSEANPQYIFSTTKSHGIDFLPTQFYGKSTFKNKIRPTENPFWSHSSNYS
jgi:hypothetical protein